MSSNEGQAYQIKAKKPRKERKDKGKKRKNNLNIKDDPVSSEDEVMVSGSDASPEPVGADVTASLMASDTDTDTDTDIAPQAVVEGISVNEAEAVVENAVSYETSSEIVAKKKAKKGSKYTDDEVDEVRLIIQSNPERLVLTNKQLEIAKWIEAEDIKIKNRDRKSQGMSAIKSEKASFCMEASFDKAFFLELQNQYTQEDGEVYTLQAFQHAINAWFFQHINTGNAYARSGGYKRIKTTKSGCEKVVGVNIPIEFFKTENSGFLQGYLLTDEGKAMMEIGEELQRTKRTANKSSKGTNETKEQRARNAKQARDKMNDDELEEEMARMMAELEKRKARATDSDGAGCASGSE